MASTSLFGTFCLKWLFLGTNICKILQVGEGVWPLMIICSYVQLCRSMQPSH